ncbi:MAG: hypothetical protein ACREB2_14290 [Pseudolabrys sp.]
MTRTHIAALLALAVAIPAATAAAFHSSGTRPCFSAGASGYRISDSAPANVTVRIDNMAATPDLRLQLVDDPAAADFVLVDDSDTVNACSGAVQNIRLDPAAEHADLTVTLSRAPADYKIYVRSDNFSQQDAAALFAVLWNAARKDARAATSGREFAARN